MSLSKQKTQLKKSN